MHADPPDERTEAVELGTGGSACWSRVVQVLMRVSVLRYRMTSLGSSLLLLCARGSRCCKNQVLTVRIDAGDPSLTYW